MDIKITELKNKTEFAYKRNPNTPRVAFNMNFSHTDENIAPGIYSLMVRLFMQGTKSLTAQQLSEELDKYAIEFSCELKQDYIKFKIVCLNEDIEKALEIFSDIIKNSTFEEFEKERLKLQGEIVAELDSPRAQVIDDFYKNIYKDHLYGHTNTVILNNLDNISKEDVVKAYESLLNNSKKVIALVGDIDYEFAVELLNKNLGDLPESVLQTTDCKKPSLQEAKINEIVKDDLNQAHILKGWLIDSIEDYASLSLLNIILGASGLSSRLFLELRDKKGLAYVVRSSYDVAKLGGNFSIYIATEPKNIEISLKGFEEEIEKIKTVLVSEEELENAKNNIFGKWAFVNETNSQQANWLAHFGINGFGFDFRDRMRVAIKNVTSQDLKNCANKYFNEKFVLSVIKP